MWSIYKQPFEVGRQKFDCSVMALARTQNEQFHTFSPAQREFKIPVKSGATARANCFQITVNKAIEAGERVPVILVVDSSMLSFEFDAESGKPKQKELPWLIVHKEDLD